MTYKPGADEPDIYMLRCAVCGYPHERRHYYEMPHGKPLDIADKPCPECGKKRLERDG